MYVHMTKNFQDNLQLCVCCLCRSFRAISVDPMVDIPGLAANGSAEDGYANAAASSAETTRSSIGPDGTVYTTRRQHMRSTSIQRSGGFTSSRAVPRLPPSGKPNLILSYGRTKEDLTWKFNDLSSSLLLDSYSSLTSPYLDTSGYSTRTTDSAAGNQRRRLSHF